MQSIKTLRSPPMLPQTLYSMLGAGICDVIGQCGAPYAEELRMHVDRMLTVTCRGKNYPTSLILTRDELEGIFHRMCDSSLYVHRQSIAQGYLTLAGGIRVGICGKAAMENGGIVGIRDISGLIVRIPHTVSVTSDNLLPFALNERGEAQSLLLYAAAGVGKTTLLASLARLLSTATYGIRTVVIDTREELLGHLHGTTLHLDVLSAFPRAVGMEIAIRSLGAQLLICDEIGNSEDADAILAAANCGAAVIATAHAADLSQLLLRPFVNTLLSHNAFRYLIGIARTEDDRFQYYITPTASLAQKENGQGDQKKELRCFSR